jgi:hypothetical protein
MAEAAGFALAVFPLLISAAEHYAEVTVAFRRYKSFADEASRLAKILNIQRVIFRITNKSLLERIVGREQAGDMLDNAHHASWEDKLTEDTFMKQLGDLAEPIVDSIQLIEGELEALGRESQKLAALIAEKEEVSPPLPKSLPISHQRGVATLWTLTIAVSNVANCTQGRESQREKMVSQSRKEGQVRLLRVSASRENYAHKRAHPRLSNPC